MSWIRTVHCYFYIWMNLISLEQYLCSPLCIWTDLINPVLYALSFGKEESACAAFSSLRDYVLSKTLVRAYGQRLSVLPDLFTISFTFQGKDCSGCSSTHGACPGTNSSFLSFTKQFSCNIWMLIAFKCLTDVFIFRCGTWGFAEHQNTRQK